MKPWCHRLWRRVDVSQGAIKTVGEIDESEQQLSLGLPNDHLAIALQTVLITGLAAAAAFIKAKTIA